MSDPWRYTFRTTLTPTCAQSPGGPMSDEVRMIRAGVQAARDRRTVPSFNDDIGDAIERDALAALARLESQNQALQERIEEAMKIDDETVSTSSHYCIGWQDAVRAMKRALSPTQETDRA